MQCEYDDARFQVCIQEILNRGQGQAVDGGTAAAAKTGTTPEAYGKGPAGTVARRAEVDYELSASPRLKAGSVSDVKSGLAHGHGDLFNEVVTLMNRNDSASLPVRQVMTYPFRNYLTGAMPPHVVQAEVFAQAGRLYFGSRALLKAHMPSWYTVMEEIFNGRPIKSLSEVHARIRRSLSGGAYSPASFRRSVRSGTDQGDGRGGGVGQIPGGVGDGATPGRGDRLALEARD